VNLSSETCAVERSRMPPVPAAGSFYRENKMGTVRWTIAQLSKNWIG